jgi:alpha-methylacyl-CoA racemase
MIIPVVGKLTVINASINLPAAVAGWRLAELGATVIKVEPPGGDPVEHATPALYAELTQGQRRLELDLKDDGARGELSALLTDADVLLTSSRPSALQRLGLGWPELAALHPRLLQVAIVGHRAPHQELAGHDLTYVARQGLLAPPGLPRTLVADLAGAERAVSTALALVAGRNHEGGERYAEVALEDAAAVMALPYRHGLTTDGGPLGGGLPFYNLYETAAGWVAVAALEPRFQQRLLAGLGLEEASVEAFATAFRGRSATDWEQWATERDIPVAAVR